MTEHQHSHEHSHENENGHEHSHEHTHDRSTSHGQVKQYFLEEYLAKRRISKVAKSIPDQAIVCDVGCGYRGHLLFSLTNRLRHGYGFDVAVDTSLNTDTITLQAADLNQHIPLPDNTADIVTSLAVLEHLSNRSQHLKEIYRILKPGGTLLLTTPTPRNKPLLEFLAFTLKVTDATEIADHKCYLTGQDLRAILQTAGFTDTQIKTNTWQLGMNNIVHATKA